MLNDLCKKPEGNTGTTGWKRSEKTGKALRNWSVLQFMLEKHFLQELIYHVFSCFCIVRGATGIRNIASESRLPLRRPLADQI